MVSSTHPRAISQKWFILLLLIAASAGMFALWKSTPFGLGLTNDSAYYIEGAQNLRAGNGYVRTSGGGEQKLITHFPPFFSAVLALFNQIGLDMLPASRVVIVTLFGITIVLAGLCIRRISQSTIFALLGAVFLAISDSFLGVYSMALSEPLFLALMLAAFLMLAAAIDKSNGFWLAGASLVMSLAVLTRYAGVSLLITAVVILLVCFWPRPMKHLGILAAGAAPLILLWLFYNQISTGSESVGNRLITWHPPAIHTLFEAAKNLLTWLAPDGLLAAAPFFGRLLSLAALLVLPGLVFLILFWLRRSQPKDGKKANILGLILALQVLIYLSFLVVSLSFFDASTPLDTRILSPAYLPLLILFVSGLGLLWQKSRGGTTQEPRGALYGWAAPAIILIAVISGGIDGISAVRQLASQGQGFANVGWKESPAIRMVSELPPILIYSNKPTGIYLITGKSAYILPTPQDAVTVKERPGYTNDLEAMKANVLSGKAVVVVFDLHSSSDPGDIAYFSAISSGLPVLADYGRDVIFGVKP